MLDHASRAAVGVAALMALGAANASAGTIHSTDGTPAFTASTAATHSFTVKGGAFVVRSTSATFNGRVTDPESSIVTVNPVYSGVTYTMAGVTYPAAVATSGPWTITSTNATSPFTASVTLSTSTTITIGGLTGSMVLPGQIKSGLTGVNSGANAVLGASVSGMAWTATGNIATLLGATSGSDATYSSGGQNINVTGVNVVP